jgi:hypothetical protein
MARVRPDLIVLVLPPKTQPLSTNGKNSPLDRVEYKKNRVESQEIGRPKDMRCLLGFVSRTPRKIEKESNISTRI